MISDKEKAEAILLVALFDEIAPIEAIEFQLVKYRNLDWEFVKGMVQLGESIRKFLTYK